MPENKSENLFYTLDEEKRTLVPHAINIGDGFLVLMRIRKKYLTKDSDDNDTFVNIKLGKIKSITYGLQRKTTRDYIPGQRDANSFSRGHVMGSGRLVCSVLDRELISHIYGSIESVMPDNRIFDNIEGQNFSSFGLDIEIGEKTDTEITTDKDKLVGGTHSVFSKKKTYVYLDDIPPFDLVMIARADEKKHITVLGEPNETADSFKTGGIYKRTLKNVQFVSDSCGADAVNPAQDQVVDFAIFGNDSGYVKLS